MFLEQSLWVTRALRDLKTPYGREAKHYDQIGWLRDDMPLLPTIRPELVDFAGAVFRDITPFQMTFRVSDHFPLLPGFSTDRSRQHLAQVLGANPDGQDPFGGVPE